MLGAHNAPWVVKSASLEQFVPPWTVRRQVWLDSLKPGHSGISTDILLFSDINLSLVHHYRIHKRGLPHIALQKNYMSRLRTLLPLPVAQPQDSVSSPVLTGPVSVRQAGSAELVEDSVRRTRRAKRRMWPVRVMAGSVDDFPILTIQDPTDVQGAMVYDCRPPLLPVLLQLCDLGPLSVRPTVASASVAVPPWEDGPTIGDVGSDVVAFPELGVAPLVDSGTDLEDELPTPDDYPSTDVVQPGEVALPEVCPAPQGSIDLELAKALLDVSVLPMMVTPIVDPVVELVGTPALYPEPPIPVLPVDEQVPVLEYVNEQVPVLVPSPLREVAGSPVRDNSSSFLASPAGSVYGPITSPISPSLRTTDVPRPPSGMAMMDQYLLWDCAPFAGESTELPLLPRPLTPPPPSDRRGDGSGIGCGFS